LISVPKLHRYWQAASPIILRVFKEEAELEVWKQDTTGHFQILKTYPICRWSGDLGPKLHEGDRQTPEGFYTITAASPRSRSGDKGRTSAIGH
jgi:murein L,D-transpeptidase YafK